MRLKLLSLLACSAVILLCVYVMVSAVMTAQTTGIISINSSDSNASITVSQANTQALAIGTGSASVRLRPGAYRVSASDNGYQNTSVVNVSKKHTSKVVLNLPAASKKASAGTGGQSAYRGPAPVNIQGVSDLNNLLLYQQFTDVIQATSNYIIDYVSPSAQNADITNTTLSQDGSIDYTVLVDKKSNQQFDVVLQKRAYGIVIFTVPVKVFSETLNPY